MGVAQRNIFPFHDLTLSPGLSVFLSMNVLVECFLAAFAPITNDVDLTDITEPALGAENLLDGHIFSQI